MIGFTARLVLRSARWVAPLLVLLVWGLLIFGNPGTSFSNTTGMYPALVIWSCWMTIATGNVDDDPHRDLLAAAIGSTARLHAIRAATVALASLVLSFAVSGLVVLAGDEPGRSSAFVAVAAFLALGSAALVGIGIGTLLHRPVLRHRGASTLLAVAAVVASVTLPPVQAVFRSLDSGDATNLGWLVVGAAVFTSASITGASRLSGLRAR